MQKKKIALGVCAGVLLFCCFPVGCLTVAGGRMVRSAFSSEPDPFLAEPLAIPAAQGTTGSTNPSLPADAALAQMNQPIDFGDVRYTVLSRTGQSAVGRRIAFTFMGEKAAPGATYVIVTYTVENTGKQAVDFLVPPSVTLFDAKGRTFTSSSSAEVALMMGENLGFVPTKGLLTGELQPGVPLTVRNVFEVPLNSIQTPGLMVVVPAPDSDNPLNVGAHMTVRINGQDLATPTPVPTSADRYYVPIN